MKASWIMAVGPNRAWLDEAVQSILSQTDPEFDLVMVNDDPGFDLTNRWKDERIRTINPGEKIGPQKCLNRAMEESDADICLVMDSDDRVHKNRLEFQKSLMEKNLHLICTGTEVALIGRDGSSTGGFYWVADTPEKVVDWLKRPKTPLMHPAVCYRRKEIIEVGGYDPEIGVSYDMDLWSRIVLAGHLLLGISGKKYRLTYYRKHPGQLTAKRKPMMVDRDTIFQRYEEAWKNWGGWNVDK